MLVASCEVFLLQTSERATIDKFLGVLPPPKNKTANIKNHLDFLNANGLYVFNEQRIFQF
jgi:hypothetical protein